MLTIKLRNKKRGGDFGNITGREARGTKSSRMSLNLEKMDLPPRSKLFDFHGVSMIPCFTDNWENYQNFQARPDDILIATYPKAGTTWVSYILDLLYFRESLEDRLTTIPIYERVPFLEICIPGLFSGKDLVDNLTTSPRLIKTHLPVQFVPKSFWEQNCRIVYMARNAKDNMVSFFHFDRMNKVEPDPGEWSSFFQRFLDGKTEEVERLSSSVQFDNMKKDKMANYSTAPVMDFKISPFMRKGKVGDWKNHFTVAQNEAFDEDYKKKMTDPTLQFRTEV
ncbi:cytosolic sulfotransferase 1 isoform X2 [Oryzias latipes]|uniref:cytosolic sulfotransferase 1 isoform X2 n=1 Tax=Oryzias latipes TaxID=8090 RepID=UPI000CE257A2|nr:cytosolic sulfotransferase 1 isoform X2 [Oryzias latipes]